MDEAANLAGRDPLEYRLALLTNQPRHRTVLEQVAKEAGWGTKLPEGHARGIALHESFKSIVALVVEVSVGAGNVRVHKVHCAIDCGRYVNPNIIRQQIEGAVIFGLSAALYEQISLKNGAVANSNFHDYRVVRLSESPEVFVSIIENDEAPGGVGEPGVPSCPSTLQRHLCSNRKTYSSPTSCQPTYLNNCDQLNWSFLEQEMFPCDIYTPCFE